MLILWKIAICLLFFSAKLSSGYRLSNSLIPETYNVEIITYLNEGENHEFYLTGKVTIKLTCAEPTNNITLHSKELQIHEDKTQVTDLTLNNKDVKVTKQETDTENEFYIIHVENPLKEGHLYEVHLEYKGQLIDGLAGYYRSSYIDKKTNKTQWLAVTQFEPTDARRAFPCFDEPSFKAKFKISLGRREELSSISNMPVEKTEKMEDKAGWMWDRYEETVPMSTYLVAFVVSDFSFAPSNKELSNVTFNIWARKDGLDQVHFAKEVGPKALSFYENFFNIPYPLPKQDMIAIPDFSAGAMENWGLITYREVFLLLDPKEASTTSKHHVASVIAHELAHQWFGNLVTMKWWTDLWLNEGFATYMASVAVEHLFPKWKSLQEESFDYLQRVYSLDALKSSHPVSIPIHNANEINQIFDTISYAKGSCLIRMMGLFLGEDVLRKGVSNYLKEHAYQNAEQDDLWRSLTQEAHQQHSLPKNLTVKLIMDTWTLQTGYPVINVSRDYNNGTAEITQERYYKNIKQYQKSHDPQCWWVPLSYTTEAEKDFSRTEPKIWLSCPKETHIIEHIDPNQWVIFNIRASGLYRVNYDERNWNMLTSHLKHKNLEDIPVLNRVLLIDNAMELAWTGRLTYDVAFDLLSYVKADLEYLPWSTALGKLGSVSNLLRRTSVYGLIKAYIKDLVSPAYKKLGALSVPEEKRDSLDAVKHQVMIAAASCKYGVKDCKHEAVELFNQWMKRPNEPNPISQDMRPVVYCTALKRGGEDEWNFLWQKYKESNVGTEKNVILRSLGCTSEMWLLNRYLEWMVRNNSEIRKQDCGNVFVSVSSSNVGFFVAKSFFENHIKDIYNRVSPNAQQMSAYVKNIASQIFTEHEQKEFANFLKENKQYLEKAKIGVRQALEGIEINVQWHKNHYKHVEKVLKKLVS